MGKSDKKRLYIAYGSNMDEGRMRRRCRGSKKEGVGVLEGYQLTFQKSISGYYANIKREKGSEVPVILYRITEEDEKELDRYEGYPLAYDKKEIEVETESGAESGLVYVLSENRAYGIPGVKYYELIERAYRKNLFNEQILKEAFTRSFKLRLEGYDVDRKGKRGKYEENLEWILDDILPYRYGQLNC